MHKSHGHRQIQDKQKQLGKKEISQQQALQQSVELSDQQSQYSSQDEDGKLLTNKVQQKLLTVVAKLKNKDPALYTINKPIFSDDDFQQMSQENNDIKNKSKLTYKDLVTRKDEGQSSNENEGGQKQVDLKKIKENIKKKLYKHPAQDENQKQEQQLFRVKKKIQVPKRSQEQKLKQFVQKFEKQSCELLTNLWKNEEDKLDKTDLFLRNYILNEKWKSSKFKHFQQEIEKNKMIDEEDQIRSVQMDEYEAKYNFRFQQPGSDKIIQYPRQIPQSMRVKPDTRKQKRLRLAERKKAEQQAIRKEAQTKKQQKKQLIIQKLQQQENEMQQQKNEEDSLDFQHDWFFCDDCTKPLEQNEQYYVCNDCGQYMLCFQCYQLIIHKHKMERAVIPIGAGPPQPQKAQKSLKKLKSCKECRRKIPHYQHHYCFNEKSSHLTQIICEKCFDQASLQIKKKFKLIQPKNRNRDFGQLLEKNPDKIKQLTSQKDIQQLVDQYLKYDFEDVIGGGLKTKFKYINVKPEGFGLSDEQILYGDDKQLNKYVSIKKLGAYEDQKLKLRNNMYKRKIKYINKSASQNKRLINKLSGNAKGIRTIKKIQTRAQLIRKRRQSRNKKLKIINISNPQNQKKYLIPKSRLQSYGFAQKKQQQSNKNK